MPCAGSSGLAGSGAAPAGAVRVPSRITHSKLNVESLFDCVYVVDKFLAELDGSFEGFKREFDRTVKGAFYDTKLIAQRFMDGYLDTLQEYGESRPKATRTRRPGSGEGEDAALPGGTSSSRRAWSRRTASSP